AILLMMPIALAQATVGQLPLARHDQDYTSALAAAEAGINDYVNRLNAYTNTNTSYWNESIANTSTDTPASPPDGNKALEGWVAVSSIKPTSLVEGYCYTVDMTGTNGHYTASNAISENDGIV